MKKAVLSCYILLMCQIIIIADDSPSSSSREELDPYRLTFIRHGFYESVTSHAKTDRMIAFIESTFSEDYISNEPILLSYYGALNALKAKHVFNPFSKISHLRSALNKLEEATIDGACNLEVRFLRFSVLHNLPSFLRKSEELEKEIYAVFELLVVDDKYRELDSETAFNVIEFVLDSKRLDEEQHKQLESLAERLQKYEHVSTD